MMTTSYDVIVIGSGLNELVAAGMLAKAGRRVLVLEARATLGGAMVTEELAPGFLVDACAHDVGWLSPHIIQALDLTRHGLTLLESDVTSFTPMADGAPLVLWRDQAKTVESIRRRSPADAAKWPEFAARMGQLAGFLEHVYSAPPPQPVSTRPGDLLALLGVGLRLRGLGRAGMVELLRVLPMPVADLLDEWFADDALKGTLGAGGITHLFQGPRSAGTAFLMLHHQVGRPAGCFRARTTARGGVGGVVSALAAAAKQFGADIRTGAEVTRIVVRDGRVAGVALQRGQEFQARVVASGADARRTFLELVDPAESDPEFLRAVEHIKSRGVWAKVNLALDGLPDFSALPGDGPHLRGVVSISPSLNYLERAYDAAKHGGVSARPYLEAVIPSLADPDLAPSGKHVMSVSVQYRAVHVEGRPLDRRPARRAGRQRGEPARGIRPEPEGACPAPAGAHARRPRGALRPPRGPAVPGATHAGPGALHAAGARLGPLGDAGRRPLPVRLGLASWRWHRRGRRGAGGEGDTQEGLKTEDRGFPNVDFRQDNRILRAGCEDDGA